MRHTHFEADIYKYRAKCIQTLRNSLPKSIQSKINYLSSSRGSINIKKDYNNVELDKSGYNHWTHMIIVHKQKKGK